MKKVLFLLFSGLLGLLTSCTSSPTQATPPAQAASLDNTVANVARVVESPAIAVRGYGIVAGLFGTGSSECPPELRQELEKYIWQQIPKAGAINAREFINSPDTAVVEIIGVIPSMATMGQPFDVVVRPLSSTQTTSLDGGHLYTTDLKEISRLTQFNQYSKTIAKAQGQIYTDYSINRDADTNPSRWYVLGGGYPLSSTTISFRLNQPDFVIASAIRNRINERFGANVANAVSAGEIQISVPDKYRDSKVRFLAMIHQLYLADQPNLKHQRIDNLIGQLQSETDKFAPEVALEAFGKAASDKLADLLKSQDNALRFHAARSLSNIGDSRAAPVLSEFVFDPQSPYRIDALKTFGRNVRLSDAEPVLLKAMEQEDIELRIAAYEAALAAKSAIINRTLVVSGNFFVDKVLCGGPKAVYVFRKDKPGIVIFGAPVRCNESIFLQTNDGEVTINARQGDKYISVSRKHPNRPRVIGPLSSRYELTQLIRVLGESPEPPKGGTTLPGLSLSYAQIIDILEKMCKNDFLNAQFFQGNATNADEILKNM